MDLNQSMNHIDNSNIFFGIFGIGDSVQSSVGSRKMVGLLSDDRGVCWLVDSALVEGNNKIGHRPQLAGEKRIRNIRASRGSAVLSEVLRNPFRAARESNIKILLQ